MISKFSEYLTEVVRLPVLDVVIDDDGNVYNGEFGYSLVKGYIEQEKKSPAPGESKRNMLVGVLGTDGKKYPAGIDKNGVLVAPNVDNEGYVLNNRNNRIRIPLRVANLVKQEYWRVNKIVGVGRGRRMEDIYYSALIPILSTGWVNTKIDMEIIKKVRRFASGLGTNNQGHLSFMSKLSDLQRVGREIKFRQRNRKALQRDMSSIMLLHYLNEIKDFFTPSSSGFLFESFIGGFIPNAKVKEDNSKVDIIANNFTYQIKLYSSLQEYLPIAKLDDNSLLDYYIICLKYPQKITIFLLNSVDKDSLSYIDDFRSSGGTGNSLSVKELQKTENSGEDWVFELELINIDQKIEGIAKGLRETLDKLYKELSQFQYNIETIVSGVDEKGNIIEEEDFEKTVDNSKKNCNVMLNELDSLVGIMKIPRTS
jgi:hypothetical protein